MFSEIWFFECVWGIGCNVFEIWFFECVWGQVVMFLRYGSSNVCGG